MSRKPRSLKQAQAQLADQMRERGDSWAKIGAEFQLRFRVNARVALRQARGWTQPEAAERWNRRWPEDPKTFKNFSYWEAWPSSTGYAPSLEVLDRLAQLYECSMADLVSDFDDYGAPKKPKVSDVRPRVEKAPPSPAAQQRTPLRSAEDLRKDSERILEPYGNLNEVIQQVSPAPLGVSRRMALLDLSSAFAIAAAAPLLERAQSGGGFVGRVDEVVVSNTGRIIDGIRKQNAVLGPAMTLQSGMALRAVMESVVKESPPGLADRAWAVYGDLAELIAWMMFNVGADETALYYYEDARAAAYRVNDLDLAAHTLASTAHVNMSMGRWQAAIDHAQASEETARRGTSRLAIAYSADMAARAYAAGGQASRSHAALDRERRAAARIDHAEPHATRWDFYDGSFYWGTESECALRLGMPIEAADAAGMSQDRSNPAELHNNALTLAMRAEALVKQGDVSQAARALGDAARYTTLNSSTRISRQITRIREDLRPHEGEAAVQELDARLARYRLKDREEES